MPFNLTLQQLSFFVIVTLAFGLLITERLRNDVTALLIVLALAVSRVLSPSEALAGFSSEPAIVVVAIFVMSAAFQQTGLAETLGGWIGKIAGTSYSSVIIVLMSSVALLSAFTHHVTTTAVMLPVTLTLARERDIPPSKLLMPLSFAASLGTTITIIGAPAFLVASDTLQRAGRPGLGIFSIAPIGLALSLAGTLFILAVGRFLLPERQGVADPTGHFRLDKYFTELKILSGSRFIGMSLAEVKAAAGFEFTVVGWVHEGTRIRGPFAKRRLAERDVLLAHVTPEDLVAFRNESGVEQHAIDKYGDDGQAAAAEQDIPEQLVQAVVAPTSDLIGRTVAEIDFHKRYGAIVVGLWRQEGYLQQALSRTKLKPGDVMVLQGDESGLGRVADDPAFLILMPFHGELRPRRKAWVAGAIMVGTIAAAALNLLTLEIAALAGAVAMVLTGCLTPRQAYRGVDAKIYVFIAGAIPLGAAMEKSGTATLVADRLHSAVGDWPQAMILLAIFCIVGVLTQFMSDAATTALFAPVALALAGTLGHPPEAYVVTVAMAAVASFLTPIGHHGNLLVYGPGGYQFADFIRVGTPLTIIAAAVVTLLALTLW